MGYGQYLRELLEPLRVYDLRPASFSGGEVDALGLGLDGVWETARENQRESVVMTAEGHGLAQWEALFPYRAAAETVEARRAAVGGFLQISGDSFTPEALSRCLSACGVTGLVSETETPGIVRISFPETMGEPAGMDRIRTIVDEILPCHLEIVYALVWCTWGDLLSLTWEEAGRMTWEEIRTYRVSA